MGTIAVYQALLQKPICTEDAQKILRALDRYTGPLISSEQIAIVTWQDYQLLWIIRASAAERKEETSHITDEYHFVYAMDQEHAATLARQWLEQRLHLPLHYYTPCPEGLLIGNIRIPGHYKADQ